MTPFLLALAALQAAPADPATSQFKACTALVREAPDKAIAAADAWRLGGGGLDARHCLGLAYFAAQRFAPAAAAFEQAAREAETKKDSRVADFWTQSGNAWLAGGDGAQAIKAFDAALTGSSLPAELRGELHLDRARAAVMLGNLPAARADFDKGLQLVPKDPFGWFLSAALARREGDLPRARKDIERALELAGNEPDILLEAGNIAGMSGDLPAARTHSARAAQLSPDSDTGRRAAAALAANGTGEEEAPAPAKPAAPQGR